MYCTDILSAKFAPIPIVASEVAKKTLGRGAWSSGKTRHRASPPRTCSAPAPQPIPIIAHDMGRSHDRSTAVIGGHCSLFSGPRLLEVREFRELPLGIYGSELANELVRSINSSTTMP